MGGTLLAAGADRAEAKVPDDAVTYAYQLEMSSRNLDSELFSSVSGQLAVTPSLKSLKIVLGRWKIDVQSGPENAAAKLKTGWVELIRGQKGKWAIKKKEDYSELDVRRLIQIANHFVPYLAARKSRMEQGLPTEYDFNSKKNEASLTGGDPDEETTIMLSDVFASESKAISGWRRTGDDVEVWQATVPPEAVEATKAALVGGQTNPKDFLAKIKKKGFLFAVGKLTEIPKKALSAKKGAE
jgi:hypothetical protein